MAITQTLFDIETDLKKVRAKIASTLDLLRKGMPAFPRPKGLPLPNIIFRNDPSVNELGKALGLGARISEAAVEAVVPPTETKEEKEKKLHNAGKPAPFEKPGSATLTDEERISLEDAAKMYAKAAAGELQYNPIFGTASKVVVSKNYADKIQKDVEDARNTAVKNVLDSVDRAKLAAAANTMGKTVGYTFVPAPQKPATTTLSQKVTSAVKSVTTRVTSVIKGLFARIAGKK